MANPARNFFLVSTLIYFYSSTITDSSPVDLNNFIDDWNPKIKPHGMPLLNGTTKNHILPPNNKEPPGTKSEREDKTLRVSQKLMGDVVRSRISCPICKLGVGLLQREAALTPEFEDLKVKFVNLCVGFKIESEEVCTGIFDVFGPDVLAVLEVIKLDPKEICSLVLGETCGDVKIVQHQWDIELPSNKPLLIEPEIPKEEAPTFKVLQISDTHFDPEYEEGSPANCQEPLCCRRYSTPPEKEPVIPAGRWGSYEKCDSPKILIENMLKHIAEEHPDIDYIIWTGDLPPHDVWNQTKESNAEIIAASIEEMFEIFPNTPIFPALGNHESIPAGSFAPPWVKNKNYSISWLYSKVADKWRRWLPPSVGNTILHGGFFSVLIRPGFRLISINTNYCHTLSWWLLANSTDPAKELEWLIYELQEAENKGHIPPGSADCMKEWSKNYYKIVDRFEGIIKGQFYGHSHADEFEMFYDYDSNSKRVGGGKYRRKFSNKRFTGRATNVAYLGPSLTTYYNFNPAYRIYYIDGDHENTTREVVDHETWTMNLEDANKGSVPKWYRLYSAKNTYNLESLRPKAWAKLLEDMSQDEDLFSKFYRFYYRDSPVAPKCDPKCKLQILCDLKSGRSHVRKQLCQNLDLL